MNARIAAAQARRELEFLEIAEGLGEELAAAKEAKAANPGDEAAVERHRFAAAAMYEFRSWARTVGRPKEGVPGRDAVIRIGG